MDERHGVGPAKLEAYRVCRYTDLFGGGIRDCPYALVTDSVRTQAVDDRHSQFNHDSVSRSVRHRGQCSLPAWYVRESLQILWEV